MTSSAEKTGVPVIEAFVRTLPGNPGVYRMLGPGGEPLYVGKAKNLKKRVAAYTQPEKQSIRIARMIALTAAMAFTVTHSEAEALLLEADLIKTLKPRYNILLRDDKSFPSILITADHRFPLVTKHRGARERKGEYFGPFASASAVNETLAVMHKAFMLRNCPDSVFSTRTRPCLQYQIRRCTGPCVGKVTPAQYAEQVEQARAFLKGKSREIQNDFARKMQQASAAMEYETAALWRDRIRALCQVQAHQAVQTEGLEDADVFGLHRDGGSACVQVFFFRGGQNFGNRPYFPRVEEEDAPEEILSAFIAQFYVNKSAPREIILSHAVADKNMIAAALSLKNERKVDILVPARGARKELALRARENAASALAQKRAADASQAEVFERLAGVFGLDGAPERVEVYDNSHISGAHALGTMIVATPDGFQKNAYRKFNISTSGGDDFAMMREVLERRFRPSSSFPSSPQGERENLPDLILLDGGQGQLSAVQKVMDDLGLSDIPLAAIAKGPDRNAGRERFFLPRKPPFTLEKNDPLLHFLQRIRDEAHRFAITSHRARRTKAAFENPLDAISGIGAKRKKALLLHFGSAKAVAEAGVSDLQKVEGISTAVAMRIYGFFHD